MLRSTEASVIYPVAIINVNGIKCHALLDTGSGSSYASEAIIDLLKISPIRKEYETIEISINLKLKNYLARIQDLKNEFSFTTGLNKLGREVLLTLPKPKYNEIINKNNDLGGIQMHDTNTKYLVPIYIILGASDFAKIKMGAYAWVDDISEPFAEQTKMGWVIMSPGREIDTVSALFTKTSVNDNGKLFDTDALGLEQSHYKHDGHIYKKFIKRDDKGWYETGLVWKYGDLPFGNNKNGSLGRLKSWVRNLRRDSEIHNVVRQIACKY